MKHIKKLYALLAVVILAAASVVWATPINQYSVHNHTSHNLGTVTVEFVGAPPQNIPISGSGNYVVFEDANLSAVVINGSRTFIGTNGTATVPGTGAPLLVNSNSTTGWDIYEGN